MTWVAVAIGGAAIVGGVMASNDASNAQESAERQNQAARDFEQQRYDDWNEIYGPIQQNLADYYATVTPEYYAAIGLENFETEYQTSMTRLTESLAQRGISDSGISASLEAQSELGAAETRAGIRRDAPRQAAEDKSRFLQIGLGQNPADSYSRLLQNQAGQAQGRADYSEQVAGQAWGNAISTVGTGLADYANTPATGNVTGGAYDNGTRYA